MTPMKPRSPPDDASSALAARAALARAALARSVLSVLHAPEAGDGQRARAGRRPPGDGTAPSSKWREQFAYTGARRAWRAQNAAQAVLAHDVGVYARALRDGGMARRGVLASVVALVREMAADAVAGEWLDTVVQDTGRYGAAGYFAR